MRKHDGGSGVPVPAPPGAEILRFGPLTIDLRRAQVWKDGVAVGLEPKAFDVLAYLLRHRERLVTKDELLDQVWADVFVTPNVLSRAIAQLRKATGDDAHAPRYIETVARRGYRWVAPDAVEASPGTSPAASLHAVSERTVLDPQSLDPEAFDPDGRDPDGPGVSDRGATDGALQALPDAQVAAGRSSGARSVWHAAWTTRGTLLPVAAVLAVILLVAVWRGAAHTPPPAPAPPLVERLTSTGDVIDAVVSPDGTYVAFVRSFGGQQGLWVRQIDQPGAVQLVADRPVAYWGTSFSPDSRVVYFGVKGTSADDEPGGVLSAVPVLGGLPRRILSGIDSAVTFSPDGRQLAFLRVESAGDGGSSLVVAGVDGTDMRTVTTLRPPDLLAPGFFAAPAWSPDGRSVVSAVRTEGSTSRLVAFDVVTGAQTVLEDGFATIGTAAWLPDGSGVLFTGRRPLAWSTALRIWIHPTDGTGLRAVTADPNAYRNVSVTLDGAVIVSVGTDSLTSLWAVDDEAPARQVRVPWARGDGMGGTAWLGDRLVLASFVGGDPQLWTMASDGTDRRQLTSEGWSAWPAASRDGRVLVCYGVRGTEAGLWRLDADGGNPRLVAVVPPVESLELTPDDQWIIYTAELDGLATTFRVPVGGGLPEVLARGLGDAAVSPDGRRVAGFWRSAPTEPHALAVFPIEGGDPAWVHAGAFAASGVGSIAWSADGRALLFTTAERANVFRVTLDGRTVERVTTFDEGGITGILPRPDGNGLLVSRVLSIRDAFIITGF
ncbi:MAG: winged helix-turn-helix domain-containing protein [Vicinamibacterales bacterium]